jgi:flavin reductase (DIM6/NTAB) family NADH-FMN oxidoreductase RutF
MTTDFDTLVARMDAPLVVVTAASGDQRAGCIVGFHTQCSIEPPRYAVWLSKANRTYRVALFATHVALHLLGTDERALVELFGGETGDELDKFTRCDWEPGPGGVPLLSKSRARMVLRRVSLWDDGSDHVCLVGTPIDVVADVVTAPLRLSGASDVEPGHEAEERATPSDVDAASEPPAVDATRRQHLENAAAGAGHPVDVDDLQRTTDPGESG